MKKITLLWVTMAMVTTTYAQQILSHSVDQSIPSGAVACADQGAGTSSDNIYWRSYTLSDFGVTTDMDVVGAEFGVSFTDTGATNPTVDVTVRALTSGSAFPGGIYTEIATKVVSLTLADNLTFVTVNFDNPPTVSAGTEVIIHVDLPNFAAEMVDVRLAGNDAGQNAPSYLSSPTGCSLPNPADITTLGSFANSMILLNLIIDNPTASLEDNNLAGVSVYPNPVADQLSVEYPQDQELISASLFDLLGKKMPVSIVNNTIDTSTISSGIYQFLLVTNEGTYTTKIVKK